MGCQQGLAGIDQLLQIGPMLMQLRFLHLHDEGIDQADFQHLQTCEVIKWLPAHLLILGSHLSFCPERKTGLCWSFSIKMFSCQL